MACKQRFKCNFSKMPRMLNLFGDIRILADKAKLLGSLQHELQRLGVFGIEFQCLLAHLRFLFVGNDYDASLSVFAFRHCAHIFYFRHCVVHYFSVGGIHGL